MEAFHEAKAADPDTYFVDEIEAYRENPDGYYVHEGQMNAVGYQLLGEGKVSEAIEVFTINLQPTESR